MEERLFPAEVVGNVPRVTLTGRSEVDVEQHRGLSAYQPEEVVFRTACGSLRISGHELRLKRYTSCDAQITGEIACVTMDGGANGGGSV
ncbi:MAG: YabP/YqfC family sporulation protein [Aristaeellaceae bacterium]